MTSYNRIEQIIHTYHGYAYQSAGVIFGFFNDPDMAESCALQLNLFLHRHVMVCGGQISING